MRLTANFPGESVRFEGDWTVQIQGLPEGAQIQNATITLTPVAAPGRPIYEELLTFAGNTGDFGMTKVQHTGDATHRGAVEVDFHARRTLAFVRGSSTLEKSELAVDLGGGVFMGINTHGATATSDDSDLYQVPASGAMPGLLVSKFRLSAPAVGVQTLDMTQVTVRTAANNVSLALEGSPPFWVQSGEITLPTTTPNFANFLQLYLADADVSNGRYQLPLIIHSDSLTRLNVAVDIEFVQQQSALPAGVDEVALPYGFDSTAQAENALVQVTLPVGAEVTAASVQVIGAFDDSRIVFGPTGPLTPVAAVPITGGRSQAQPILLSADTAVTAIDLLLSSTSRAAVLDLNLMGDVGGKPFADPLLPAPVPLELDRDLAANPTWISARLPQEFQFHTGVRYWLVIQARQGEAAWHSQTAVTNADGLQQSTTNGLAWRATQVDGAAGPLAGFFRLRRTPDQFQMPLSVLVGEGATAVPVSLDRFQPMGRIDFTIDFPEFAAAINEAARRTEATSCARGEQLQNSDFAHWSTTGASFGPLQDAENVSGGLSSIAIAPNGEWAFVGRETGDGVFVGLPLHRPIAAGFTAPVSRQHTAVSPDSQRVYVISEVYESFQLRVIDATTFEALGDPVALFRSASCLALSPDGRTLFIGSFAFSPRHGEVWALDTAVLGQLLASGAQFAITDALSGNPMPLENEFEPSSLAVSPDGRRLFVAAGHIQTNSGSVFVFDTLSHQPLVDPIFAGNNPVDLALTPDGRRALVVNANDDTITLIDAARLRNERTLQLPNPADGVLRPMAVAVEPNGRRAFVASRETASVSVIDLVTLDVRNPTPVGEPDFGDLDLAVTHSGDRLYVALANPYPATTPGLRFLPLGRQHPDNWTLTTGFVLPIPFSDPFHLTAVLGPVTDEEQATRPARTSALSQATAVVGGCTYDFSFWGIATHLEAVAEVIWRGGACAVQRTDRIPIQVPEPENALRPSPQTVSGDIQPGGAFSDVIAGRARTINLNATVTQRLPELLFHRARLQAPPGATQAEIRFLIPPDSIAVVDIVSFQATSDTITNGDLLLVENDALVGWQLSPASVTGVTLNATDDGVELSNLEAVPVSLVQSFAVTGRQPFVLLLRGALVSQLAGGAAQTAHIRLDWLDAAGNAAGSSSLPITAGQQEHQLETAVPPTAATADLNLVVPAGTTLVVRQLSFVPVELVTIPIHFLAQAPGNLTVTGFDVAYDVGDVATTPPPPDGFCPPTPPGRSTDGKGGCCHWCASPCGPCGDEGAATDSASTATARPLQASAPRRRAVVAGTRPALMRAPIAVAAPAAPEIRLVETAVAPLLTATPAEWAARAPELAAASVALATVSGIAETRALALTELGIDSVPRLATAAPETVATALRGVSLPMAERFVTEARAIRANVAALPAPLVSCMMLTLDRRPFVPLAIDLFLRQDYPNRELIILDDGADPVGDLVPDDERIRYIRLTERLTIGAKRNRGGEAARGPILASWDDDVWVAPWRLSYQVGALTEFGADVVGLDNLLHYDPFARRAWHSVRPSGRLPWMPGSTFCYTKAFWQTNLFPDVQMGEDIRFLRQNTAAKIVPLQAITWLVDIIHQANVSPKPTDSPLWFPYPLEEMHKLLGADEAVYARLAASKN